MDSCKLTASIMALANALACQLSTDEVSLLGATFVQLGDTLATIALQRTLCEPSKGNAKA